MGCRVARPLSSKYSLERGYSFNLRLGKNLEFWRKAVRNQNMDFSLVIDGKEGSGKTVLGQQVAEFFDIDGELDLNTQICFTPKQFEKAVLSLKQFKSIVWDEARSGLNRRRSTQKVNTQITDMLSRCRRRNLFLIIIMPAFYDMDLNVAVHRTRALIHVWYDFGSEDPDKPLRRGFFRFYTEEGKKSLYTNKFHRMSYNYPFLRNSCFDGTFTDHWCVDEKEYDRLKFESEEVLRSEEGGSYRKDAVLKVERGKLLGFLVEHSFFKEKRNALDKIAEFYHVSRRTLYQWMQDVRESEREVVLERIKTHNSLDREDSLHNNLASPQIGQNGLVSTPIAQNGGDRK